MNDAILAKLQCPRCRAKTLRLSASAVMDAEWLPPHGYLVCDACNALYPIAQHILDMAIGQKQTLTLAGWSNHFFPTPQLYEPIWRRRALSILTGENFSVEREYALMNEWTNVQAGESVMDLGTSTGLYARGITPQGVTTVAIDLAWDMLTEAQKYIAREKRQGIVLMRAAAEILPFRDESMDAVVVGGSFNEMNSMEKALQETQRVVRRDGRMFVMSLSQATKMPGQITQTLLTPSGIKFPNVNEFNAMVKRTGWNVAEQELKGIVLFSLLKK